VKIFTNFIKFFFSILKKYFLALVTRSRDYILKAVGKLKRKSFSTVLSYGKWGAVGRLVGKLQGGEKLPDCAQKAPLSRLFSLFW
jgi:hypothetical protein